MIGICPDGLIILMFLLCNSNAANYKYNSRNNENVLHQCCQTEPGCDVNTVENMYNNSIVPNDEKSDYFINSSLPHCAVKCCPQGFQLVNFRCVPKNPKKIDSQNCKNDSKMMGSYAEVCRSNMHCQRTNWKTLERTNVFINVNGSLYLETNTKRYQINQYCYDVNNDTGRMSKVIFFCEPRTAHCPRWVFMKIILLMSCGCLIVSLAIYVLIYRLRNLFHKLLACYCLVDLAYWFLYTLTIFEVKCRRFCTPFAFIQFFLMISRLSWLNVLSFELWNTIRPNSEQFRWIERKKMMCYTSYAVLIPIICSLFFVLGNQITHILSSQFIPLVNEGSCLIDIRGLDGNMGVLFLYIPISILMLISIFCFTKMSIYHLKSRRNFKRISSGNTTYIKNIKAYRKGFVVFMFVMLMGISCYSYYFYVYASTFTDNAIMINIFDVLSFADVLEGILIFLLFIAVKEILKLF